MRYLQLFEDFNTNDYGISYTTFINDFFKYVYELMELKPELLPVIEKFRKIINWNTMTPVNIIPKNISFKTKDMLFDYLETFILDFVSTYKK